MVEDRLAEIKARRPPAHMPLGTYDLWHDIDWLIAEVLRLRDEVNEESHAAYVDSSVERGDGTDAGWKPIYPDAKDPRQPGRVYWKDADG